MNQSNIHRKLYQSSMVLLLVLSINGFLKAQGCDFLENDAIQLSSSIYNMDADYTQQYALTTSSGNILDIKSSPSFAAQSAGNYFVYALNYETAAGISGFSSGNNIASISGTCFDTTRLAVNVCLCTSDCHATDGTITLSIAGANTSTDFTQSYAVTDNTGAILDINTNPTSLSPLFLGLATGNYRVYALNYETVLGINNYTIGNNIDLVTGGCLDMEGPICYNICTTSSNYTGCNSNDGTVSVINAGFNQELGYTQTYALADTNGIIQRIKDNPSNLQPLFVAVATGKYRVYALNYETASGINNYSIGTSIENGSGSCLDIEGPIYYEVCTCPFTGCNASDGTVSINNTGFNSSSDFTQVYALTDTLGSIIATTSGNPTLSPLFSNISAGYYHVYGLNYETTSGVNNFSIGNNIDNVTGVCFDIVGALCYQICTDTIACHSEDGTVSVNSSSFNKEAGYTQSYALVDTNGIIQRIKDNPITTQSLFWAVPVGTYKVYALNYEVATGINNFILGNAINAVTGTCLDIATPIDYRVCPCPFTGCNSTDGVISISNAGYNQTVEFTQAIALTDTFGLILQTSVAPNSTDSLFELIPTGYYHIYAINYETATGISGLITGNNIANVSGTCFDITGALCYQVCNDNYDFGDLPDTSDSTKMGDYQTLAINNGPVHVIIPGLMLGSSIDSELDGQPTSNALGDGIDEDGLSIFPSLDLFPNLTFRLPFSYINTTGNTAHVEAWIDWNGDGDFDEINEMVADWTDATAIFPDRLETTIPVDAKLNAALGLRIRISHQDNMTPYGMQSNGEVEDYLLTISCPTPICLPIKVTVLRN